MKVKDLLFSVLGINRNNKVEILTLAKDLKIPLTRLEYYNDNNILPDSQALKIIEEKKGISKEEIMLGMGIFDTRLKEIIRNKAKAILDANDNGLSNLSNLKSSNHKEVFRTEGGKLFQGDCISLLSDLEDETFDLVFADPPFNLNKIYPSEINDNLTTLEYIKWTEDWLDECIRTLKTGGSLFLWNIPKWNSLFAHYLNQRLTFRHWIAVDIKYSLPIQGRLYPSHYSLLYYVKGEKPKTFHPDRLPMEICPKCYKDLKDYGGYKNKMNPLGINLTDVWFDIPPVRHTKYKGRKDANELSIKLLDRIIEMASDPDDLIFDPFGGSGTTYVVSEIKKRKWIGIELGPIDDIVLRFKNIENEKVNLQKYQINYNKLFPDLIKQKRKQLGLWTDETFSNQTPPSNVDQQGKIIF